jgi:formate dehydrogenase major subunit
MIEISLNGKKIKTEPGKTILQLAEEHGISIPTLCHDKELKPFGSCWVCAVEVKGRRGFVTSCGTEIADGMEIVTDSKEIHAARKMALELLLSDHYADCEAPCKMACPDKVDVQTYVSLIANGQLHEAVKVIKENLPMPLSIGRVCPAFCEEECRRSLVDDSIAIRQLKRHAADFDLNDDWTWTPEKEEDKGKKIAIVGAGPSGLTCGFYLSNKGYDVTVYEAAPAAGGWLRYGIPEYRLPKAILDKEIELMCANGMKIELNKPIGKDITLDQLSSDFDAVYLAIGAQNAVPMRIEGSNLKGCFLGVDYLKDFVLGKKQKVGKKVAIIGGGNTAIDCARTARRKGAEVTLVYRRTRNEMPAEAYEVDAAEEEGVKFYFLTNPVENIGEKKKLKKIKFEKMELGEPDESGRRRPQPTGKFFEEEFDTMIAAISQSPDVDFLADTPNTVKGKQIPLTRWSTAEADEASMYIGFANVFAGGDFRRGPATAIEAIADGRIAADSIDNFLNDRMMVKSEEMFNSVKEKKLKDVNPENYSQYKKISRYKMPELEPEERATNFEEVELGFSDADAKAEADRCLECGCQVNSTCDLRRYATDYKVEVDIFAGIKNEHPIDHTHPFIQRDPNKCVKCGRCVRICAEVQGPGVLGYIYRGFANTVAPEFGESLNETSCEMCGKCIDVCPVGALLPKNVNYKMNPHATEVVTQSCGLCATGCKIDVSVATDKVTEIRPAEDGFNDRNLCFNGKFGWQIFEQENRLMVPMVRDDDNWESVESYDEITEIVKEKFDKAKKKKIYISPICTNEEILMMQRVAENSGSELCSISNHHSFVDKLFHTTLMKTTYHDLKSAENIVVVGKISKTLATMCRLYQRSGKKLIIITNEKSDFNNYADELFTDDPVSVTLDKVIEYYTSMDEVDEFEEAADVSQKISLELSQKTVFLYTRDHISEEAIWNVWFLSGLVCDFGRGSGVLPLSHMNNFRGLKELGVKPGRPESSDFVIMYGELPCEEQKKKIKNSKFLISYNTHLDSSDPAHVIIPKCSYLEIEGTALANDGRISEFHNPRKSDLFDQVLITMRNFGFLSEEEAVPQYWEAKAQEFLEKEIEYEEMTDDQLLDYLNSVERVEFDKPKQNSVQKKLISKLKKKAKPHKS